MASGGYLFAAGLLGGLSLSVHSTVALTAPAILLYLLLTARSRQDWLAAISGAALGVLLALGAFLALDARNVPSSFFNSVARPSLSVWGLTARDFASPFQRLNFLYTADQFRCFILDLSAFHAISRLYLNSFNRAIFTCAALGLLRLFWRTWKEALLVIIAYACLLAFVLTYAIQDIYVFFVPALVPLVLLAVAGLAGLMDGLAWLGSRVHLGRWSAWGTNGVALLLIAAQMAPTLPALADSLREGYPIFLSSEGLEPGHRRVFCPDPTGPAPGRQGHRRPG